MYGHACDPLMLGIQLNSYCEGHGGSCNGSARGCHGAGGACKSRAAAGHLHDSSGTAAGQLRPGDATGSHKRGFRAGSAARLATRDRRHDRVLHLNSYAPLQKIIKCGLGPLKAMARKRSLAMFTRGGLAPHCPEYERAVMPVCMQNCRDGRNAGRGAGTVTESNIAPQGLVGLGGKVVGSVNREPVGVSGTMGPRTRFTSVPLAGKSSLQKRGASGSLRQTVPRSGWAALTW